MSIIRAKEMRSMEERELRKRVDELRLELTKSQAQVAIGGAPPNPGRIGEIKRTIARALTIRRERASKSQSQKPAKRGA
ncbi:MAG: 50S ribosomal protein L29 [Candidatus Aenigmatarchaeota archaeon]|nr:MAG: 50S ribosomal protein L29 [Candidatus Aenigmarchaeota archaeon]